MRVSHDCDEIKRNLQLLRSAAAAAQPPTKASQQCTEWRQQMPFLLKDKLTVRDR
jgi:hypothetical protein